jgi:hypothetical protein
LSICDFPILRAKLQKKIDIRKKNLHICKKNTTFAASKPIKQLSYAKKSHFYPCHERFVPPSDVRREAEGTHDR